MNEYLPPWLGQFGGSRRSVREVHVARARTTTWSVPLDDTHTSDSGLSGASTPTYSLPTRAAWPNGGRP